MLYHEDHSEQEFYACCCWVKVVAEGAIEHIFDNIGGPDIISEVNDKNGEEGEALIEVTFQSGGQAGNFKKAGGD